MNAGSRLSEGRSYEGRGRYMTVRLSEEELKGAKGRALERAMTVSEYVRVLILADGKGTDAV
jgi:predicted DNA binding CopG/RHH family protein